MIEIDVVLTELCECSARRKEEKDRAQERGRVLQLSKTRSLVSSHIFTSKREESLTFFESCHLMEQESLLIK